MTGKPTQWAFLRNPFFWLLVYVLLFAGATIHRFWLGPEHYNNFTIFQWSFRHLAGGIDLYAQHPADHYDLFKYSPTFALFMAPFAAMPPLAGLLCWNLLNVIVLWFGVKRMPLDDGKKSLVLFLVIVELMTSVQNSQSNALMTGLMLLAFGSFERRNVMLAALFICLGFYVKLFALVIAVIFLFYDQKLRFIFWMLAWGILLAVLPVLVTGIDGLLMQYKSWLNLLAHDPAHNLNFSIMTITQRWFGMELSDLFYLVPGGVLLLLPLLRTDRYSKLSFRVMMVASVLLWVVIFNHKAESPTFVIAFCGAAVWFAVQPKSWPYIALYVFVFILTGLSATDLFPRFVREQYIVPYCLKVLPCIVLWFFVQYQLLRGRFLSESRI